MREGLRCALAAIVLIGIMAGGDAVVGLEAAGSVRADVTEAAVRWGLSIPHVARAAVVYLEIDQGDPSDDLLTRLADMKNLVSVAKCPREEVFGVLACRPAKGSVLLTVWDVEVMAEDSARARVGHYEGPTSGMACQEYFARGTGGWRRREAGLNERRTCGVS